MCLPLPPLPGTMDLMFLVFFLFLRFYASFSAPQCCSAIFNFGDSLADTGNFLITGAHGLPSVGRLPYGMTTFGRPTGRCSDGRVILDFMADAFRLPLVPPSLARGQSFRKGANFAVTGATALDMAFFRQRGLGDIFWTNHSLGVQLRWFEELKPSLCNTTQECRDFFGESLFIVGEIGENDCNFPLIVGGSLEEVGSYVPNVIEAITEAIERLIEQGAMHLMVPGSLPAGCFPLLLTLYEKASSEEDYDPETGCLRKLNELARDHNTLLLRELSRLRIKYPGVRIIYADYYGAMIRLARSPKQFGFSNGALKACCGGGGPYNFNFAARCGEPGSSVCEDPSSFVSWDGIHLTEAAYQSIAIGLLTGPYADPPIFDDPHPQDVSLPVGKISAHDEDGEL